MAKVEERAGRANLWTALFERALKLLQWIGLAITPKDALAAIIAAVAWGGAIFRIVPWYVLIPVTLLALATMIHLFAAVAKLKALGGIQKFDPAKARELGSQLVAYSRNAMRHLNDWEAQHPRPPRNIGPNMDPGADWELDRRREAEKAGAFREAQLPLAVAHLATLDGLGVHPPFHAIAGAADRPEGLISYLGAIGHLLEAGHLEEAKALAGPSESKTPLAFHLLS